MSQFPGGSLEAVQFTGPASVPALADLVRKYRPQVSYADSPALGTLRFYGDRDTELNFKLQQWAAVVHGRVVVLPESMYQA